jgi:MoxR-like ATPase
MSHVSLSLSEATALAARLRENVGRSIFGQEALITETICCLLAGGHILMTGAPGLAKTTLVRVFARHLGLAFGRVQFTPDLLPSDILGSDILNIDPASGRRAFEFAAGPVFTNLLLADEINRASPRTQSALLEAMQERAVTIGGKQHILPQPFMVFATQNPFESEGTFPLPEAQLDRFLVHTLVDYPDAAAEQKILEAHAQGVLVGEQVGDSAEEFDKIGEGTMAALIARARNVQVDASVVSGIRDLVRSSRPEDELCPEELRQVIWYGAGPRAGLSLVSMARALALVEGSEFVRWHEVRRMAKPVLRHRLRLTSRGSRDGFDEDQVVDMLMKRVEERQSNLARGIG